MAWLMNQMVLFILMLVNLIVGISTIMPDLCLKLMVILNHYKKGKVNKKKYFVLYTIFLKTWTVNTLIFLIN